MGVGETDRYGFAGGSDDLRLGQSLKYSFVLGVVLDEAISGRRGQALSCEANGGGRNWGRRIISCYQAEANRAVGIVMGNDDPTVPTLEFEGFHGFS
jgi:hypothetical protein